MVTAVYFKYIVRLNLIFVNQFGKNVAVRYDYCVVSVHVKAKGFSTAQGLA